MPELPEVETILNGSKPFLLNNTINEVVVNRENLRIPFPKELSKIKSKRIIGVRRRGKYMLWELEDDIVIILHLGMSGRLRIQEDSSELQKHDHIEFCLLDGKKIILNDPRRFGLVAISNKANLSENILLKDLGKEPLSNEFNASYLLEQITGRKKPIKNLLMDSKIVVGVGNIYACESLYRAQINPAIKSKDLNKVQAKILVEAIKQVLLEAIKSGGSTLRDFQQFSGESGYFQHRFSVYGQKTCKSCGAKIAKITQAGRTTFFCPHCQHV